MSTSDEDLSTDKSDKDYEHLEKEKSLHSKTNKKRDVLNKKKNKKRPESDEDDETDYSSDRESTKKKKYVFIF